jgi:hypothetical protein
MKIDGSWKKVTGKEVVIVGDLTGLSDEQMIKASGSP